MYDREARADIAARAEVTKHTAHLGLARLEANGAERPRVLEHSRAVRVEKVR